MSKKKFKLTNIHIIMLGFLTVILTGAILLALPFAARDGQSTSFINSFFTSVSATCVTGLVQYDTWTHFNLFGQLVILTEIQVGGLGVIVIDTFLMILFKIKISKEDEALIQEYFGTLRRKGGVELVKRTVTFSFSIEAIAAIILAFRFVPEFGFFRGIYFSIFHSISAFCNAGFDLMGIHSPYASLINYNNDPLVILTISSLIIIGGIGFLVWDDIHEKKLNVKEYNVQTKIVLFTTAFLLLAGTILFYIIEQDRLLAGESLSEQLLSSFFCAVSPRTAGFNSVELGELSGAGSMLTMILMFIGGGPSSTAGGIKTTTIFILLLSVGTYLVGRKRNTAFHHHVGSGTVRKASMVFLINLFFALGGAFLIMILHDLPLDRVLFESFSAIGTVGMSLGVSREVGAIAKIILMILMFAGRMGSLTFAMSLVEEERDSKEYLPMANVHVG